MGRVYVDFLNRSLMLVGSMIVLEEFPHPWSHVSLSPTPLSA